MEFQLRLLLLLLMLVAVGCFFRATSIAKETSYVENACVGDKIAPGSRPQLEALTSVSANQERRGPRNQLSPHFHCS